MDGARDTVRLPLGPGVDEALQDGVGNWMEVAKTTPEVLQ